MKKITKKMVVHWLGKDTLSEAIKTIMEIANSKNEANPWTPHILYDDIKNTCNVNKINSRSEN